MQNNESRNKTSNIPQISELLDFDTLVEPKTNSSSKPDFTVSKPGIGSSQIDIPELPSKPCHQSSQTELRFDALLESLVEQIKLELEIDSKHLLKLNPSRRILIAEHLLSLAKNLDPKFQSPVGATGSSSKSADSSVSASTLSDWLEGPKDPVKIGAIRAYFHEIALMTLGQSLVLSSWNRSGHRTLHREDLSKLNWAISATLKTHVPMNREGWQITKPNLYSWFNLSQELQDKLWSLLQTLGEQDYPTALLDLFALAISQKRKSVDPRFYSALWHCAETMGFSASETDANYFRKKTVFCLTMEDGSLMRTGCSSLKWVGMEKSPFLLYFTELQSLWEKPRAPMLWAMGDGLEAHTRSQLPLVGSIKPTLLDLIAESEACDLSFVMENDRVSLRDGAKGAKGQSRLEALPYYRKFKNQDPSLGILQTCVSLTKMRPGGIVIWCRNEPLTSAEGTEALKFLLDHGVLAGHWDFSGVEHQLPSMVPLFFKHVYVWRRELSVSDRHSHRPTTYRVSGSLRSHIEVPIFLKDAFASFQRRAPRELQGHLVKSSAKIVTLVSPLTQKDWAERWPEPARAQDLAWIQYLQTHGVPLAQLATLCEPQKSQLKGFSIWWCAQEERVLTSCFREKPESERSHVWFVATRSERATLMLARFLESSLAHIWLTHHCPRKGGRLVLDEQVLKALSIPEILANWIENPDTQYSVADVQPAAVGFPDFKRALEIVETHFESWKGSLLLDSVITRSGRILWEELLKSLPSQELLGITGHPWVSESGFIPPHVVITQVYIQRPTLSKGGSQKTAGHRAPGIYLNTEPGHQVAIQFKDKAKPFTQTILDIIESQLSEFKKSKSTSHLSYSEFCRALKLPHPIETVVGMANDIIERKQRCDFERETWLQELDKCLNPSQSLRESLKNSEPSHPIH